MDKILYLGNINGAHIHNGYAGAVYDTNGLSPTIMTMQGGGRQPMIVKKMREKKIGNINGFTGGNYSGNVYDDKYCSPTLNTMQGGNTQPMIVEDDYVMDGNNFNQRNKVHPENGICRTIMGSGHAGNEPKVMIKESRIVAMRGRNLDNPSDRTAGIQTEQRLEPRIDGITNTITTVQKDNLLMEEQKTPVIIGKEGTAATEEEILEFAKTVQNKKYRIRKLTPLECYRLMGVSDDDAKKMLDTNSNTQCYKQAGNSIVVPVLMALFSQMNIDGVKRWNDMSEDEIYNEYIDKHIYHREESEGT